MKKAFVTLLCCLISYNLSHARFFNVGPRMGVHILPYQKRAGIENHWDYHIGAFTRISLLSFYVQPEIILTNAGIQLRKDNSVVTQSCTRLDTPIMAGLSFLRVLRVQTGPIISFLLSAKEGDNNIKGQCESPIVGWQTGLGIDIWKIVIDLKYEGVRNRRQGTKTDVYLHNRYMTWVLSVGINLL